MELNQDRHHNASSGRAGRGLGAVVSCRSMRRWLTISSAGDSGVAEGLVHRLKAGGGMAAPPSSPTRAALVAASNAAPCSVN